MDFLHAFIAWLASFGVLPPEVLASDADREKTYLVYLPDSPDKAVSVRIYDGMLPSLAGKQAGVFRIQVLMRNPSHAEVANDIFTLWQFLCDRPEYIEDISPNYWVIIDTQTPPIPAGRDDKGNYLYSLNFPVTTKMF